MPYILFNLMCFLCGNRYWAPFFSIHNELKYLHELGILAVIIFNATRLKHPTCGFTYYGLNIVVTIVSFFIYVYFSRKYKYRQRDEICNVYRYAEEYYSRYQEED